MGGYVGRYRPDKFLRRKDGLSIIETEIEINKGLLIMTYYTVNKIFK